MKKVFALLLITFILFSIGCTKEKEVSIRNVSVNANGTIHIEGRGRAFESTIKIVVKDGLGFVDYEGSAITDAKDMGEFGNFQTDITLTTFPQTDKITVSSEVISPKDGSIAFSDSREINYNFPYKTVKVFYGNTNLNPGVIDCSKVFPVERRIASNSQNPPLDTTHVFLLGPTKDEETNGYVMSTPKDLTIHKIEVVGSNKVQIDFGEELQRVGGSCRVAAIRAEITETLRQFYPGYEVVISINGNVEEALQP